MERLDRYPKHPGRCALCGSGVTPVVDPQRDFPDPRDGHIYICRQCVEEASNTLGYVHPDAELVPRLERRIGELEDLVRWYRDEVERKQKLLDAMFDAGYRRTQRQQDRAEADRLANKPAVTEPKGPGPKTPPEGTT